MNLSYRGIKYEVPSTVVVEQMEAAVGNHLEYRGVSYCSHRTANVVEQRHFSGLKYRGNTLG